MSRLGYLAPAVRKPISIFLGLTLGMLSIALANKAHLLDVSLTRRAIGFIIGVMAMVTGNFLPKARPLKALDRNSSSAIASERFAGWTLFLGGTVYASLFLSTPLNLARPLSSCVGAAMIFTIAANWIWYGWGAGKSTQLIQEEPATEHRTVLQGQREILFLLFAILWIFATAGTAFLENDSPRVHSLASWVALGFGLLYAVLLPFLESRMCPKKRV